MDVRPGMALGGVMLAVAAGAAFWSLPAALVLAATAIVAGATFDLERVARTRSGGHDTGLAELVGALGLRGHGVHVPVAGSVRLWIPPAGRAEVPRLRVQDVLLRDRPDSMGVVVTPPGAALEATFATLSALPQGGGPAQALVAIRDAFKHLDLGLDVHVGQDAGRLRITYQTRDPDACIAAMQLAPWHLQGGCPTCSLAAMLAARSLGRPLRTREQSIDDHTVTLELEAA